MNQQDLAKLQQLAQGDGEMRVGKRLMRALLGEYSYAKSGQRVSATAQRLVGSPRL